MKGTVDFNNLVIVSEASLLRNGLDKGLLIKESFLLWYILVEGVYCENFTEGDIKNIFLRNVEICQSTYADDADCNFIIGWMLTIAFWYFDPLLEEEDGVRLLDKAYRSDPKNSLFKWGLRKALRLNDNEIENLRIDIASRYDQFYNYGTFIKKYFLDVI
jgi:hypothetical protein